MNLAIITENFIDTIEEFGELTEPQRMAIRGALISNLQIVEIVGMKRYSEKLEEKQIK